MTVRAKFYVSDVNPPEGATAAQVTLHAVCRGVENAMWAQATPSGQISMNVKNDAATEQFEKGAEYEVTFRKVARPTAGDGHQIVEAVTMHGAIVCEVCGSQLGYTAEQAEKVPSLASYASDEHRADARKRHDEVYSPAAAAE